MRDMRMRLRSVDTTTGRSLQVRSRGLIAAFVLGTGVFGIAGSAVADYLTGMKAFHRQDYATALETWIPLAQQGDGQAQVSIGYILEQGLGVQADAAAASEWYASAAEQGVVSAQYNLGRLYATGSGVPRDMNEAARLWGAAADRGHIEAMHNIGVLYYDGIGVPQNAQEAASWLKKSADAGFAESQFLLGGLHESGIGVSQSEPIAVNWYRLAAAQGHPKAIAALTQRGETVGVSAPAVPPASQPANQQAAPAATAQVTQGQSQALAQQSVQPTAQQAPIVQAPAAQATNTQPRVQQNAEQQAPSTGQAAPAASLSATSAAQIAAVPPEPAVNGNFRVWIASFRAEEQAAREWSLIMEQHQNIFGGMQPEFRQVDLGDKGLWYRVVAGPFAARAGAETACSTLRLSNPAAFCRILEE